MQEKIDSSKIGLLVGLECHQQLATQSKLFCSCKPSLFKGEPQVTFIRQLRPTQSELGQIDPAAFFEFKKGVRILYEASRETSCLVEMDEEPPHSLNAEALETALIVALMMNAKPVDEVHVMRKTVIDGSNTTGFQRTCVVALNGWIDVEGNKIPIEHICLEEDAARKTRSEGLTVHYRIDRLGIPLIEVTTGPVIRSPEEAQRAALAIGRILRATGRVRRGIGTIRQDLNISIRDGALIEIKGVQELELISKVVEYEARRQLGLIEIREELKKRKFKEEEIKEDFKDVTEIFNKTSCRLIRRSIEKGKRVLAVKLPKFSGLLSKELCPGMRLGKEMADRARFWGKVAGIFHTDELPAYGITEKEILKLKSALKVDADDVIVFVADTLENAREALKAVLERALEAAKGVPEETRAANPDGTTRYMRPRPGAARMYPETDIPPIQISEEYIFELRSRLPELPEETMNRLIKDYGLNMKLARQLVDSEYLNLFKEIARETSSISPTVIAATLTETLKALKREGVKVDKLTKEHILDTFKAIGSGKTTKEAIPEILSWLAEHTESNVEDALKELGLTMISREELESLVERTISENIKVVKERGQRAFGFLMGTIMKRYRGRLDARILSEILKDKLKNFS